jgi:hypothetical protein
MGRGRETTKHTKRFGLLHTIMKTIPIFLAGWLALLPGLTVRGQNVLPPHSVVEGKTLAEWSAAWWQWIYAQYVTNHPWFDQTGANAYVGQGGPVFYLVGASGATRKLTRSINLPADKYLFFPLINYLNAAAEGEDPWGTTVEDFYDSVTQRALGVGALQASLDGVALTNLLYTTGQPVTNLYAHREVAPEFSVWFPPTNNIPQYWGFNYAGFMDPAVSDGFWIMLAPLSPGSHVVRFGGVSPPPGRFELDFTYQINPMKLESVGTLTNGLKKVSFTGPVGQECILQASTNLVNWSTLATNTITGNPTEFVDADAPHFTHRFYRVQKKP